MWEAVTLPTEYMSSFIFLLNQLLNHSERMKCSEYLCWLIEKKSL